MLHLVAQSGLTLCDPMGCSLSGSFVHRVLQQEYWSGSPCPPPGDLPNPGIKPRSPALQADSLPAEPQGSPRTLEWVAYPFFRGSSQPRNQTGVSYTAGWFFTCWATREPIYVHVFIQIKGLPVRESNYTKTQVWMWCCLHHVIFLTPITHIMF